MSKHSTVQCEVLHGLDQVQGGEDLPLPAGRPSQLGFHPDLEVRELRDPRNAYERAHAQVTEARNQSANGP